MRRIRPARLPLIVAWLVIGGVLWYLAAHPRVVTPYASGLVSRHLLRIEEGGLRVRDLRFRMFEGVDLYGVSLTLPAASGGLTLVSADTVEVDFHLREALGAVPHLRRVVVRRPEVFARTGVDTATANDDPIARLDLGLPDLIIDHLEVSEALLEMSDSRGRLRERIRRLDWRGALRSGTQASAVLRGCNIDWETHASLITELRGDVVVDGQGVAVRSISGRLNGNPFRLDGRRDWDDALDLAVDARGVSVAEVEELIDQTIGFSARGDLVGTFVTSGDALVYEGTFTGELEGYRMQDLAARAIIRSEEVGLTGLSGVVNGAAFAGHGRFDIRDPQAVTYVLEGDVRSADLSQGLVPGEDDLPETDGAGRLRIEHADAPLWTRVSGILHDGFVATIPFDTCYVDVEADDQGVWFNRVEIQHNRLQAVLEGHSDSTRVFRGSLSLNSEDLRTLPATWGWPQIAGRANGLGTLSGPLDDLRFEGDVSMYGFGLEPLEAATAATDLVIEDVLEDFVVSGAVSGRGFVLGGVPMGDYRLQGSVSAAGARLDTFSTAYGDTAVLLRSQAAFSDSLNRIMVEEFRIDLEGTRWSLQRPLSLTVGDGHFAMDNLGLASDQGRVSGGGVYDRDNLVAGGLKLQGFDLALLNPFVDTVEPLAGRLTADLLVGGEPNAPQVSLSGDLLDAPFSMARIDSLHVTASLSEGTLDFETWDLHSEYGRLSGSGTVSHPGAGVTDFWPGADLDLDLDFVDGDWAFLDQFHLPALDRLAGRFTGRVGVTGTTHEPLIQGNLRSEPFHIHWLHLDDLESEIWVDSRALVLGGLRGRKGDLNLAGRIEVPVILDLMSEPVSPPQGPFYMQLDIPADSDLTALSEATNAFVTAGGTGEAHVIVSGPLEHPFYQGTARLRDVSFVIRDLEEVYREASCDLVCSGDEMRVRNIRGREGLNGTFSGEGVLRFRGLELETFDIGLNLDRFLVASIPDLRAIVSGEDGRMTGVKVGPDSLLVPRFSGDLEIVKARYTGTFEEKQGASDPRMATVAPDWLADLRLHAQPRVAHIVNRDMELDLGGDLDLIRTEAGLYLRGSLDVNKGRLIVFNNDFAVERGNLDFSSELGFDPRLDLDAATSYRLRGPESGNTLIERIGVHVSGTLAAPIIDFTSERGYSREAIQRMLLGLDPQATPGGDSGRLAASSISAGFNLLEREIARELSVFDTFEIDQIQRERDATTGATGLDPLIGVGKYIGSDLYLKYAQGLRQDDRDIVVEYQINQHLLLQSEIRRRIDENQGGDTYNLDLKYRFEY